MPSCNDNLNQKFNGRGGFTPYDMRSKFPSCLLWPPKPHRGDLHSDLSVLAHPFVIPIASNRTGALQLLFIVGKKFL